MIACSTTNTAYGSVMEILPIRYREVEKLAHLLSENTELKSLPVLQMRGMSCVNLLRSNSIRETIKSHILSEQSPIMPRHWEQLFLAKTLSYIWLQRRKTRFW